MGWDQYSTETLLKIHANLRQGLDKVAEHAEAGTLEVFPKGKASTPLVAGYTTFLLYEGVEEELKRREDENVQLLRKAPGNRR